MKNKGVICALFVMLLWGLLFPTVKLGYAMFAIESVGDILTFAGFRFLVCGLIITAFAFVRDKGTFASLKNNWLSVLLSGVFAIILHYGFMYVGLDMTSGSKTAILKQLGVVFYICFSPLFFKDDKLTLKKICGLFLGLCGILVINWSSEGFSLNAGDLLIIAASFCTVFSNVISKKALTKVQPIVLTGVSQLFGGAVLFAIGSIFGGNIKTVVPKTAEQFTLFGVIVLASVISYCLWFLTVQKENLSKLFIIKFAEPIFAALFGCILLGEDIFNINYIAAFLMISAGIVVANLKDKIPKR